MEARAPKKQKRTMVGATLAVALELPRMVGATLAVALEMKKGMLKTQFLVLLCSL